MTFGNFYFAGGPASLLVIVLTAFALFAAVVAVVVTFIVKNPFVPGILGMLLVFLGVIIAMIGIGAGMVGRARMNQVLVNAEVDPAVEAQIRAEGEREANQPLLMGVLGGALPGLAGAAIGMVALKRRADARALN